MPATYSFMDVLCAISGPGGSFDLSSGGIAEEGITLEFAEDKSSMTMGADGEWMHNLHAASGGSVTVRLLKTSPVNHLLSVLYAYETATGANFGQSIITLRNPVTGDTFVCEGCGLRRFPTNVNAKEGGTNEWSFNVGRITPSLGDGNPALGGGI